MSRTEAPEALAQLVLPRKYLFVTQTPQEFQKSKMKRITHEMSRVTPEKFLNENPITVIGLEVSNGLQFVIWDGHTRSRLAGRHNISSIPALIYDIQQLADARGCTSEKLGTELYAYVAESEREYERLMMQKKGAYLQKEILPLRSIKELLYMIMHAPHSLLHYGIDVVESGA
jgi:hypothetical protein